MQDLAAAMDRMQRDLAAGRDREAASLAAARDFAAAAGHELRTPLSALATDLAVLRVHPDLTGPDREALLGSLNRAERRLTATLAALQQLAGGDLADASVLEDVDLADLLPTAVAEWRAAHAGFAVELGVPAYAVMVRGWPGGLRLALDNLLGNVLRHGATRAMVSLGLVAADAVLTVDDDGPGVSPAERTTVLGRFVRGTGAGEGSGLGLALVAQQAALHGGSVQLGDAPLGGLRAELRIPVAGPGASVHR